MQADPSPLATLAGNAKAFSSYLLEKGILERERLRQVLETQQSAGGRLDTVLLDMGLVTEYSLLDALGQFHSTRTVSVDTLGVVVPSVARIVSPRIATRLEIVPFRLEGKTLSVATLNPGDLLIEDELSLLTDCRVASYVTLEVRLYEALRRLYGVQLSIQITSVLSRLNGEATPVAKRKPVIDQPVMPPPATPKVVVESPVRSDYDTADIPEFKVREEPVALEISQEDLDLFPSLRSQTVAAAGVPLRLHGRPPDEPREEDLKADPDERLLVASLALQNAEMREDIADALLKFCTPILRRRLLLAVRNDTVIGWRGEGTEIDPNTIRKISIPLTEPSVFIGLVQGTEFWLGPLPAMPGNKKLMLGIGKPAPSECVILPLIVRGKTVCFLYGDNVEDSVAGLPLSHLRRLVAKASLAFQVYILKSKIRNL